MVEQGDGVGAHVRKPVAGRVVRLVAMAVAARVVGDDAPSPCEPRDHPGPDPMLVGAGAEAVNQEHGRAVALVQVMNLYPVGIEEGHRDDVWLTFSGSSYNSRRPAPATRAAACAGARDSGKIASGRNFINTGNPMSPQNNK